MDSLDISCIRDTRTGKYARIPKVGNWNLMPDSPRLSIEGIRYQQYRKVPKFSDARKLCCNLPKIETKRPNLRVFRQKDANGIAKSEDPDQTAPLGAV